MRMRCLLRRLALALAVAAAGAGCAAPAPLPATALHAGWYMEHDGAGVFRPCGQDRAWRVTHDAALRAAARDFGLQPDTPVYVRLAGSPLPDRGEFRLARVEQLGSPTPVRDCPMTGVVLQSTPER